MLRSSYVVFRGSYESVPEQLQKVVTKVFWNN